MVDEIINLIVAMDDSRTVSWLCLRVVEKGYHVIEIGNLPNSNLGIDVHSLSL